MPSDNEMNIFGEVAVYASVYEPFKQQVLKNPADVLRERGVDVPKDVTITAHADTANDFHVVVQKDPLPPSLRLLNLPAHPTPFQIAMWIISNVQEKTAIAAKLKQDPVSVLVSMGVFIPEGIKIYVWEDTDKNRHMVIPFRVGPAGQVDHVHPMVLAAAEKSNVNAATTVNAAHAINASEGVNLGAAVNVGAALQVGVVAAAVVVVAVI